MNKFVETRAYADPEIAARKLLELANAVEAVQDGRIHIEKIKGPFIYQLKGTPAEYKAGLDLWLRESGTYVKVVCRKGPHGATRSARREHVFQMISLASTAHRQSGVILYCPPRTISHSARAIALSAI
jgi:hypothetical protein